MENSADRLLGFAMLGPDNSIWDDDEWVSWNDINREIEYKEWRAKYPNADLSLVPIFEELLSLAETYHVQTGRHLHVYGDIGELFGAITYGIKLHSNFAEGSDGKIGNDFVEIKTIAPFNGHDKIMVKLTGNFNKLFVVKINRDFEISGKLVDRKTLPKRRGKVLRIRWSDLQKD